MLAESITNTTAAPAGSEAGVWSEDPLTARSRATWTAGDFLHIARSYATGAAEFVERLNLGRDEAVLDVACGTGNLAIPAARAGARVAGVDIAPNLIAEARQQARAAGCQITFDVGDAEMLPCAAGQFDTTMTMFGAMFAFRPERVATELTRVTRRGGRVVMANWIPTGFAGKMLKAHVTAAPPPAGVPSSLEWGKEEVVRQRFGDRVSALVCTGRVIELSFPFCPAAVTELFASYYGPTVMTLRAADPAAASRLRDDLTRLFTDHNIATDGTTVVASEYLEVMARVA